MQKLGRDCMLSGSIQIAMALAIVASFMTIIVEAQMQSPHGSDAARVFAFLDTVSSLSTLFFVLVVNLVLLQVLVAVLLDNFSRAEDSVKSEAASLRRRRYRENLKNSR